MKTAIIQTISRFTSHRNLLWALLILYSALVFFGVVHHEPWRDEAHPWVSAREDSIGTMLHDIHYAPRPLLWFFILSPLAKSGFPYITMSLVHAGIAIVAVALLLFLSKLPLFIKVLFIFSYYMAYEYAVIARNYVLSIPLLFCIAIAYRYRHRKPLLYALLIVLLYQTDNYSMVPAGILTVLFGLEIFIQKKFSPKKIPALAIMVTIAFLSFVMLIPYPCCIGQDEPAKPVAALYTTLQEAFAPSIHPLTFNAFLPYFFEVAVIPLSILVIASLLVMLWKKKTILLLALGILWWLLYANVFIHGGTLRHHGLILVYVLFIWWIFEAKEHIVQGYQRIVRAIFVTGFSVLLAYSSVFSFWIYYQDYMYNFSGAWDMAHYIKSHALENATIVLSTPFDGVAVLPYFPGKKFWYPETEKYDRYHFYDRRVIPIPVLTDEELIARTKKDLGVTEPILLILSNHFTNPQYDFFLIHRSISRYFWGNATENFWLYGNRPALSIFQLHEVSEN